MFNRMEDQAKMEKIGMNLERAMQDVNIIVMHPEEIRRVIYETSEDSGTVFEKDGPKFIMLKIEYDDKRGLISKEKRGLLDGAEKELMAELEKIKKEKERYE
jgi:hypothetical protein